MKRLICFALSLFLILATFNIVAIAESTNSLGDVNDNGIVETTDLLLARKRIANIISNLDINRDNLDVNTDGKLTALDVLGIRQHLVKKKSLETPDVIFISSLFGRITFPFLSPYCASKFAIESFASSLRKEMKNLERGRVVIFAWGTVHPYFTTDTAAALRATEINAEVILLGKSIDAVYSADPKIDPNAEKYEEISYIDVLNKDLKVMDSTSTAMCRDNNIPLLVFGIDDPENIVRAVKGEKIGTIVS